MSDPKQAWVKLLERFADGRKLCNCSEAYVDKKGRCAYGCSSNCISAKLEIGEKVLQLLLELGALVSLPDAPEQKNVTVDEELCAEIARNIEEWVRLKTFDPNLVGDPYAAVMEDLRKMGEFVRENAPRSPSGTETGDEPCPRPEVGSWTEANRLVVEGRS